MMATPVCSQCAAKLREIDFNGKWLQGCLGCNKWGELDGNLWLSLPAKDLEPLGDMVADRARTEYLHRE